MIKAKGALAYISCSTQLTISEGARARDCRPIARGGHITCIALSNLPKSEICYVANNTGICIDGVLLVLMLTVGLVNGMPYSNRVQTKKVSNLGNRRLRPAKHSRLLKNSDAFMAVELRTCIHTAI
jgi:hypothetical protein